MIVERHFIQKDTQKVKFKVFTQYDDDRKPYFKVIDVNLKEDDRDRLELFINFDLYYNTLDEVIKDFERYTRPLVYNGKTLNIRNEDVLKPVKFPVM